MLSKALETAGGLAELLRRVRLDMTGLANLLIALRDNPILRGRLINGHLPDGDTTMVVPHGLGRAYQGGFMLHQSQVAYPLVVITPPYATLLGIDITKSFVLATTMTLPNPGSSPFAVWIF